MLIIPFCFFLKKPSNFSERSALNVDYKVATVASSEFKAISSKSRMNQEMRVIIKRTFEPIIIKKTFERSIVDIRILVLQTDGGVLHTAINAVSLALADASIPITDYVCSCSAGILHDQVLSDLSYMEEALKIPAITVAITPRKTKVVTLEASSPVTSLELEKMVNVAIVGCEKVCVKINDTVKDSINKLLRPVKDVRPITQ